MEILWMWAARSFTSPADLSTIELAAAAMVLAWNAAMLAAVCWLRRTTPEPNEATQQFDEAA